LIDYLQDKSIVSIMGSLVGLEEGAFALKNSLQRFLRLTNRRLND